VKAFQALAVNDLIEFLIPDGFKVSGKPKTKPRLGRVHKVAADHVIVLLGGRGGISHRVDADSFLAKKE
jgi:hypothetical protein